MAKEPTLEELKKENTELKEQLNNTAPVKDDLYYQRELKKRDKQIENLTADLDSAKKAEKKREVERKTIEEDKAREASNFSSSIKQVNKGTRFTLSDKPARFPHLNIDRTADGPTFDLGVDLDGFDGSVYVPAWMIIEMGRSIGMLTEEDAEALKKKLEESEAKNNEAANRAEQLKAKIDESISDFHTGLSAAPVIAGIDPENDSDSEEDDDESDAGSGQADGDNSEPVGDGVPADSGNGTDNVDGQLDFDLKEFGL